MEFRFSLEEETFRQEVYDFFIQKQELADLAEKEWNSGLGFGPSCWEILREIGAKGWLCPTWPTDYGGLGLSYMYRYIIMEQMHYFLNI